MDPANEQEAYKAVDDIRFGETVDYICPTGMRLSTDPGKVVFSIKCVDDASPDGALTPPSPWPECVQSNLIRLFIANYTSLNDYFAFYF